MKKIFLYILAGSLCFSACKKDDDPQTFVEPDDVAVRNTYDDQAIQKFLNDNYLDSQGNIKAFSVSDTIDDHEKKLSELNPVKLPSGVVYVVRAGAQPTPGKAIGGTDVLKMMIRTNHYLATNTDGTVALNSPGVFVNTINNSGSPLSDPMWYYVKEKTMTEASKDRSFFEIEGFQEGLKYFKSFVDKPDGDPYNLQGVILVPSRAAFARSPHYNYTNTSLQNRTFVFNFQIYDTKTRLQSQE
ncbi:hypothetical protein IQ37_04310 [Chryseobacterium piperi]|uniref:Uncharacterized protein n=1 Tax=Chryseobacterium piperi TaxID=558152 RepID=A0A086BL31_9FLAO|nr:hypothetical protein [Chryseobacterium piperi]ASW74602.1 hypothetical protein CJF12_10120 [Chryseobacterium piperi]KFF29645.1 hypothetical protein IQ37_04310 [Chryseobacterium piperi]